MHSTPPPACPPGSIEFLSDSDTWLRIIGHPCLSPDFGSVATVDPARPNVSVETAGPPPSGSLPFPTSAWSPHRMLKFLIPCFAALCTISPAFAFDQPSVNAADRLTEVTTAPDSLILAEQPEDAIDQAGSDEAAWPSAVIFSTTAETPHAVHPATQPTHAAHPARSVSNSQRNSGGIFSNMMELERRKNAWLKRTFLGR